MTGQKHTVPLEAAPLLGDPHPLLERISPAGEVTAPALATAALQLRQARTLPALREFLGSYRTELLLPLELPAILQAYGHAVRHEARELVALDLKLAAEPRLAEFAAASYRVGQRQLNKLRPLRDHRLVQRYRMAIERGEAHGWHTLVYGVSLGVYSLPLRQGLLSYASHTLNGFIQNAAPPLALTLTQSDELYTLASRGVPEAIARLLVPDGASPLRVVP